MGFVRESIGGLGGDASSADGSHALRGSLARDAPRRYGVEAYAGLRVDAERQGMRSHAERWNDQKLVVELWWIWEASHYCMLRC